MDRDQTLGVLAALADEFASMRTRVDGLSSLVFDHVQSLPPADRPRAAVAAQAVDEVGQSMQALGDLARALSAGGSWDAALADVRLADLAHRLRCAADGRSPVRRPASSGDLVLFE